MDNDRRHLRLFQRIVETIGKRANITQRCNISKLANTVDTPAQPASQLDRQIIAETCQIINHNLSAIADRTLIQSLLEFAIREHPILNVAKGDLIADEIPSGWNQLIVENKTRTTVLDGIRATARIQVTEDPTGQHVKGTGYVVGKQLLMTSRRVARSFSRGVGHQAQIQFNAEVENCLVDFSGGDDCVNEAVYRVGGVVMIHPYWDVALLHLPDLPDDHPQLRLSSKDPNQLNDHDAFIVGYPGPDTSIDITEQLRVCDSFWDKKLMPGKIHACAETVSFGRPLNAITHDCAGLAGLSGAPLIHLNSGLVIGTQFKGGFFTTGFSTPMHELAKDEEVTRAGLEFVPPIGFGDFYPQFWQAVDSSTKPSRFDLVSDRPPTAFSAPSGKRRAS